MSNALWEEKQWTKAKDLFHSLTGEFDSSSSDDRK